MTKDTTVWVARIIRLSQPQIWIGWRQKAFALLMDLRLFPFVRRRASHKTVLYPHQHGVVHNRSALNTGIDTWPELLQRAGYRTGFFGKIHYATADGNQPGGSPHPGFDRWVGFRGQGDYNDPTLIVDGKEIDHRGYNTDLLANYAEQFISQANERPWVLCLWYKAPHGPFTPPVRYADIHADAELPAPSTLNASLSGKPFSLQNGKPMGHEQNWFPDGNFIGDKTWEVFMRDYARTMQGADDALGRLLDVLDQTRMAENTIVVHSSDHGYFHGEFGLADKRWMYDPSIRVPYLVRYPQLVQDPGRTVADLILSLDIPATIMDLSGLGLPDRFQGYSLRPLLDENGAWARDDVFIQYFEDPPFPDLPTMTCLRTASEKLIHYLRDGEGDEFYDLVVDPEERQNVVDDPAYSGRVTQMRNRLEAAKRQSDFSLPDLSRQY